MTVIAAINGTMLETISPDGGTADTEQTTSLTTAASVVVYPPVEYEPIDENNSTLDYLAPLIVILLATLIGIIVLFSCVLCTCKLKGKTRSDEQTILSPNSPITCNGSAGGNTPTPPSTKKRAYNYSSLPVILAYQKSEVHAEWCPQYQPPTDCSNNHIAGDSHDSASTLRVDTTRPLPWRSSSDAVSRSSELRQSYSEEAMDRVTVV